MEAEAKRTDRVALPVPFKHVIYRHQFIMENKLGKELAL
jgi:hypothetical protein